MVHLFVYHSNDSSLRKSFRRKKEKSAAESQQEAASGEIDSITDAQEINAILNQLREDERQNELKRINQTIDQNERLVKSPTNQQQPVHKAPPPSSKFARGESSGSIDEDEMLNSIIGCGSEETDTTKASTTVS